MAIIVYSMRTAYLAKGDQLFSSELEHRLICSMRISEAYNKIAFFSRRSSQFSERLFTYKVSINLNGNNKALSVSFYSPIGVVSNAQLLNH